MWTWTAVLELLIATTVAAILSAVWVELRRLRELVYELLLSNRENSRSVMAAIHEAGAQLSRLREGSKLRVEDD